MLGLSTRAGKRTCDVSCHQVEWNGKEGNAYTTFSFLHQNYDLFSLVAMITDSELRRMYRAQGLQKIGTSKADDRIIRSCDYNQVNLVQICSSSQIELNYNHTCKKR